MSKKMSRLRRSLSERITTNSVASKVRPGLFIVPGTGLVRVRSINNVLRALKTGFAVNRIDRDVSADDTT